MIDVLKRFRPTKIAVEASVTNRRVARDYAAYLADTYTLTRNETDQIGYRLARALGHAAVHPVDEDGEFPYLRVKNYAIANGRAEQFQALEAANAAQVQALTVFLRAHTILETLKLMNSDSLSRLGFASYYAFVPFGQPYEYAGPDLLAEWFKRNIRIYHNIRALASSPEDRILVVYGAGHLGILRQMVTMDAGVVLRTLEEFLAVEPPPR